MDNKEKLEEAKRLYETANADQKYVLESLFPELKEPEDVRIKKALIDELKIENSNYKLFKDIPKERFIAWLEKQGEQKSDTDFSDLRTWKYIIDAVLTEIDGIGSYLDSPLTEEVAKKLQKRFGNIEQKPAWSEEDKEMLDGIIVDVEVLKEQDRTKSGKAAYQKEIDWLKNLKDRVQPQSKQEWSEEEEKDLFNAAKHLREYAERCVQGEYSKIEIFSLADRIESLRPQIHWKPSEEQMKALWDSIPEDVKEISEREMLLNELYKDLKKL